jgi:AcrR family transcriptional regulator
MHDVEHRRPYSSRLRTQAAARTRLEVVRAALALFLERGYAATSMDQIARGAGVSRPTVFAVGTKAQLFKLARDMTISSHGAPALMAERAAYSSFLASPTARDALARFAELSVGIAQRYGPLNEVLRQGAAMDPELRALGRTSEAERLKAARRAVAVVASKGPLRDGLDVDSAADILWLLIDPDQFRRMTVQRGWSVGRYQAWQADAMIRLLLPEVGG